MKIRRRGGSSSVGQVDSARANLASTFVNAFVNAGFGKDLLMTPEGFFPSGVFFSSPTRALDQKDQRTTRASV